MKWVWNKCRRYENRISLLVMNALAGTEREALETHLANCPACRAKLGELTTLTGSLSRLGEQLPEVEASGSLRRRWIQEVRASVNLESDLVPARLPAWLPGRFALGSLAATWALVVFFRFAAPDTPSPTAMGVPLSWHEAMLVLQVDSRQIHDRSEGEIPQTDRGTSPKTLPPRSQRLAAPGTATLEAA